METAIKLPTQEFLLECFIYNKVTGSLVWKARPLHHFKNTHGMNTFNSTHLAYVDAAKAAHGNFFRSNA